MRRQIRSIEINIKNNKRPRNTHITISGPIINTYLVTKKKKRLTKYFNISVQKMQR